MLQNTFSHQPFNALIIGASGTIGAAFAKALQQDTHCTLFCAQRSAQKVPQDICAQHFFVDFLQEQSIIQLASDLKSKGVVLDLVIDATGFLHNEKFKPEKKLADLDLSHMQHSFMINTFARALLCKHLLPLLRPKAPTIYAQLSARVGSITDNNLGGWHTYRASKAASNQILQTVAIAHQRTNAQARFVALQPGTILSPLSSIFASGHPLTDVSTSVQGLLQAMDSLVPKSGAHFIDHQGQPIAW